MKRLSLMLAAALAAFAACSDDKSPDAKPEGPLAPIVAPGMSAAAVDVAASSVCQSYQKELAEVKAQLEQQPGDGSLTETQAALTEIIADVCS